MKMKCEKNNPNKNERQSLKLDVLERRQVFLFGWTMTMIRDTHDTGHYRRGPATPSSFSPAATRVHFFFLSLTKKSFHSIPKKLTSQNFNFTIRIFNSNWGGISLSFLSCGRLGEIVRGRHQPRHLSAWLDVISQMRQKRKRATESQHGGRFFFFNPKILQMSARVRRSTAGAWRMQSRCKRH